MDNNSKIIAKINQYLHNAGVKQDVRFDHLLNILEDMNHNVIPLIHSPIIGMMNELDYTNKDLIQELFMTIGSKFTKFQLDQFYTPLTISEFICGLMTVSDEHGNRKNAIDPAGGTGDLLIYFQGDKTIWDIDPNALKLCKFNYELNRLKDYHLVCRNSLDCSMDFGSYDYCVMNPPFGTQTVVTDSAILDSFELGRGKKKQELGILFIELGLKLLKEDGLLFIILPSGYMGNKNKMYVEMREMILRHRIVALIELPKNTFKRSGTGVSTYLLIIQKKNTIVAPYEIAISGLENIGYNLCKKETPRKYKVVAETGLPILDSSGNPILDNDLVGLTGKLREFISTTSTIGISSGDSSNLCELILSDKVEGNILDIKRYKRVYMDTMLKMRMLTDDVCRVDSLAKLLKTGFKVENEKKYKYIDIGEINSPLHSYKEMYGWELPSRAKYPVKKYDILISKLEGTMCYCVVLSEEENIVCTNGVCVLRPNDMNSLYVLFTNIMSYEFRVQHTAYLTGSIMASLADEDIAKFLVNRIESVESTKKIVDTLELLHGLRN